MWKSSKHHSFVLIYFINIVQNGTICKCSNFEKCDFRIKFCISLRLDRSKTILNKNMKCQRSSITSSQWSHLHNFHSKLTTKNVICRFYPQIQYFYGFNSPHFFSVMSKFSSWRIFCGFKKKLGITKQISVFWRKESIDEISWMGVTFTMHAVCFSS